MTGKVFDRHQLVVDRSPAKQLAVEVGKFPPLDPLALVTAFANALEEYGLEALEQVTGLDLTGLKQALDNLKALLGGVDLFAGGGFDPAAAVTTFFQSIPAAVLATLGGANWGELFEKLSGQVSPEDGLQAISDYLRDGLFGKIGAGRLPLIGLGRVRDVPQNEFLNGDFDGPDSLRGSPDFTHDATDGFDDGHVLGSAVVVADGGTHILRSNNIEVNQSTVELQVRVKRVGLVAAAASNAVRVNMAGYLGNTLVVAPYQVTAIASPAGDSAGPNGWGTLLTVTIGPTPASVDNVHFELVVTGAATAGVVKFDKATATLTDKLPQDYVSGLPAAISGLWSGIQSRINDFRDLLDTFGGFGVGTGQGQLTDVATRIQGLNPLTGKLGTGWLSGLLGQNQVSGLPALSTAVEGNTQSVLDIPKKMFDAWYGGSSGTGAPEEVTYTIESIKAAVINGWTVETFIANDTWIAPANITDLWYILMGGAEAAQNGPADKTTNNGTFVGGQGGQGGGYRAEQIDPATVPGGTNVAVVVGAGGATSGAPGGLSSCGGVSSIPGVGAIASAQGYTSTTSAPGNGGNGGNITRGGTSGSPTYSATAGTDGTPSALGANGNGGAGRNTAGTATAGTAGANVSLTSNVKSGGGGGGGGGGSGNLFGANVGGAGGAGGYPGGGPGGGGAAAGSNTQTVTGGARGAAPNGVVFIMYKVG